MAKGHKPVAGSRAFWPRKRAKRIYPQVGATGAAGGDKVWQRLAEATEIPGLATDPRYLKSRDRIERADELEQLLADWIADRDFAEIDKRLGAANVPFGGIYTAADIAEDPHYKARNNVVAVPDEDEGTVVMPGVVPKLAATPGRIAFAGPAIGRHNAEIYGGLLKKSDAELAALAAEGVI